MPLIRIKRTAIIRISALIGFLVSAHRAHAVVDSIGVERKEGVVYVRHKVEQGETWYAVARRYSITFVELRMANKSASELLKSGQVILVPPRSKPTDPRNLKNYTNEEKQPTATSAAPASSSTKHIVAPGETLYGIARKYNVSASDLVSWNGLDASVPLKVGQRLQIRKVTSEGDEKAVPQRSSPVVKEVDVRKSSGGKQPVEPVKPEKESQQSLVGDKKPLSGYVFAGSRKQMTEQGVAAFIPDEDLNTNKYYALHRSAPFGTIIKVTNRMNGKSVFVKVVGVLPDTGENEGLIIKLSRSAAEQLGVLDQRFQVELLYGLPAERP